MKTAEPRVLHAKFAAYLGWSQPFLHNLVRGLSERHPTAVMTGRRENRDRFPLDDYLCIRRRWLMHPSSIALVAAQIRQGFQPNLMHAHFGWSGIRVLILRQVMGIPLVTTFGGRDAGAELTDSPQRDLYRMLLEQSAHLVCVSGALREALLEAGAPEERTSVIRRGTPTKLFPYTDRSQRSEDETLRLLMVGRLVAKKGHELAFRAMRGLRDQGIQAELRIVGQGRREAELRSALAQLGIESQVELIPPTDQAGVLGHMKWADVLVQCSRTPPDGDCEGIPNVVIEAAATGLPVVGSAHGGIPETIRDGQTGLLVAEDDSAAVQDALLRLARRPDERHRFGKDAAAWIREEWSHEAQLDRHEALYQELLRDPPEVARLPDDLLRWMLPLFGPQQRRPYDHRTLHVAHEMRKSMERRPAVLNGKKPSAATKKHKRKSAARERMLDAKGSLSEPTKRVIKAVFGRALEPLLEWRRSRHYEKVAGEQSRIEREIWHLLLTESPDLLPTLEIYSDLARLVVDESCGKLSIRQ